MWTNVNIAALAQISAGIIREIARSRLPEEPVWARDAFCVFYSELVIMVFLRLTARAIAMRQTIATSWCPVQIQKWNRSKPIHNFNRTFRIKQFEQALLNLQDTLRQMPLVSGLQLVAVSTPPVGYFAFKHGFGYLTSHIEVICFYLKLLNLTKNQYFKV